MQRITVPTNGFIKDTNCWLCKTAPPRYCCWQPHPTVLRSVCSSSTAPTKPKKLASTVTPLQNNWSPLQKELLRHAYSEAIYNYGEADLRDLSEPCIHGQFLNLRGCKAETPCSSAEQCLTGLTLILPFINFSCCQRRFVVSALWLCG